MFIMNRRKFDKLVADVRFLKELVGGLDIDGYNDFKRMSDANKDAALKQGHWYLNSKADVQLLEQVIQKINENEDLCALFTTSDGATLSLRVHKQPERKSSFMNFDGDE